MHIRGRDFALSLIAAMIAGAVIAGGFFYRPQAEPAPPSKLDQVQVLLKNGYVAPIDEAKLIDGAINGIVDSLKDPYTNYMGPEQTKQLYQTLTSSIEGIGVEFKEEDGYFVVVTPIAGSPSEKAGLRPGDRILAVNGVNLVGMNGNEAVLHVRGPKGSEAKLLIERAGVEKPFEVVVIRDTIPLETVWSEMLSDSIGIIRIGRESERTADEFVKAMDQLKAKGMQGLIIDLRQNPGGLTNQVVKIAEVFLPKDKVIYQEQYREGEPAIHRSQAESVTEIPVVVLIDKGSASAAEILAGALKESGGVPLVGETTYGKGTVQTVHTFEDQSTIKYTIAQWLTPNGNQIHEKGIKPDYEVRLPDYAYLPYVHLEREYKLGEQDPVLATVQKVLQALGHDPGRTDGLLDEGTARAVQAFQAEGGLPQTGAINPATVQKAYLLLRDKIIETDPQEAKAVEVLRGLLQKR